MERTKSQYNLRNRLDFITTHVHNVFHGTESILYLGSKIWDIVREEFKQTNRPCDLAKFTKMESVLIHRI